MEEVVSSNLTRSTKTFHRLTVSPPARTSSPESNWSPKPILSTGSHGHRVDFDTCPRSSYSIQCGAEFGHLGHRLSSVSSSSWDDDNSFPYKDDAHRAQGPPLLLRRPT